jgi:hypothetical protein
MIAIVFQGARVVGTNEDIQACSESKCEYIVVESLPPIFDEWWGSGKDLFYENEEFRLTDRTPGPSDWKAQLESDNAFLALQLVDTQARLDVSEQAQADLILSLVEKGVL